MEIIVSRFKDKLVKMIKVVNGRFDDYSISPKIRQILLHWGYELVENEHKQELLQKAKDKYHKCGEKEKAANYYLKNGEILKENTKSKYRNLTEEEKKAKQKNKRKMKENGS